VTEGREPANEERPESYRVNEEPAERGELERRENTWGWLRATSEDEEPPVSGAQEDETEGDEDELDSSRGVFTPGPHCQGHGEEDSPGNRARSDASGRIRVHDGRQNIAYGLEPT